MALYVRYRRNNTVYESIRAPCLAKVFIQRFLVPFLSESGKPSGVFIVKANCLKNIHEVKWIIDFKPFLTFSMRVCSSVTKTAAWAIGFDAIIYSALKSVPFRSIE